MLGPLHPQQQHSHPPVFLSLLLLLLQALPHLLYQLSLLLLQVQPPQCKHCRGRQSCRRYCLKVRISINHYICTHTQVLRFHCHSCCTRSGPLQCKHCRGCQCCSRYCFGVGVGVIVRLSNIVGNIFFFRYIRSNICGDRFRFTSQLWFQLFSSFSWVGLFLPRSPEVNHGSSDGLFLLLLLLLPTSNFWMQRQPLLTVWGGTVGQQMELIYIIIIINKKSSIYIYIYIYNIFWA